MKSRTMAVFAAIASAGAAGTGPVLSGDETVSDGLVLRRRCAAMTQAERRCLAFANEIVLDKECGRKAGEAISQRTINTKLQYGSSFVRKA